MLPVSGPGDHFLIDDIDYAFVTDVSKVPRSINQQPLGKQSRFISFFLFIIIIIIMNKKNKFTSQGWLS
jgi:hypothetical protein